MPTGVFSLQDGYLSVNAVDLSSYVRSITGKIEADELDTTAWSSSGFHGAIAGLKSWSFDVEFNQDFATATVDATLYSLVGATAFQVELRASKSTPRSATNPGRLGPALLLEYPFLDGAAGDLATTKLTFTGAGALASSTTTG